MPYSKRVTDILRDRSVRILTGTPEGHDIYIYPYILCMHTCVYTHTHVYIEIYTLSTEIAVSQS